MRFLVLKHISYRLLRIGVHFIKHDIQGCIFKMCRNFTYELMEQRRRLKAIKKNVVQKINVAGVSSVENEFLMLFFRICTLVLIFK
jgi:hypothetical protein